MKALLLRHAPPAPVLAVAALAAVILLLLIAKTITDFLFAVAQLGLILVAIAGVLWAGNYLLRNVRP